MEPETMFLNKLLQKSPDTLDTKWHIYVQSKWTGDGVELRLQDTRSNKCYKGELSKTEMQEAAAELEIPYEAYYAECHSALTTNITLPGFEYEIDEEKMVFRLNKKQEFDIQYLEVELKLLKYNYDLLDAAIQLIEASQKAEVVKVETAHKSGQSNKELLESYQLCLEEKKNWKQQMLKKFALLLNSKKDKIVKLEEKLQCCKKVGAATEEECERDTDDDVELGNNKTVLELKQKEKKSSTKPAVTRQTHKTKAKDISEEDDNNDFNAETERMTPPHGSEKAHARRAKRARVADYDDD